MSPSFRTAINIPQNVWPQFREKLCSVGTNLLKAECKLEAADAVDEQNDCSVNLDAGVAIEQLASSTSDEFS